MNEISINSIVRKAIMYHHLSIHYYLMFLSLALRGLKELKYHSLSKPKAVRLTIADDNTVTLPVDFLSDVMGGYEVGDKVRPMGRDNTLNTRDDEGTTFEATSSNTLSSLVNTYQADVGNYGFFGLGVHWDDGYTVLEDQGKIRVDANHTDDHFHLLYLSTPTTASTASLINPLAEESLLAFIAWKWSEHRPRNRFAVAPKQKDYYNAVRILRAAKNKMNITDIKRAVRKNLMQAPKN